MQKPVLLCRIKNNYTDYRLVINEEGNRVWERYEGNDAMEQPKWNKVNTAPTFPFDLDKSYWKSIHEAAKNVLNYIEEKELENESQSIKI